MRNAIVLFIAVLALSAVAELTVLDFENLPDEYLALGLGQNLADYYPGVTFGPEVTVLDRNRLGYQDLYFPPHSGDAVVWPGTNLDYIRADFTDFVCDHVQLWYTCYNPIYLEAYDASDQSIATATGPLNPSTNNLLSVTADNIAYVIIHDDGSTLTIDDFAFSPMEAITNLDVSVDVSPGKCPNPLSIKGNKKIDVAICGTSTLDVNDIDIASLEILGVKPVRSSFRDVSTPVAVQTEPQNCLCNTDNADGFIDLLLKFDKQAILAAIGPAENGDSFTLLLTGVLQNGTQIHGQDCIVIVKKGKK